MTTEAVLLLIAGTMLAVAALIADVRIATQRSGPGWRLLRAETRGPVTLRPSLGAVARPSSLTRSRRDLGE